MNKKILIIVLGFVILSVLGVGGFLFMSSAPSEELAIVPKPGPHFFVLDPFDVHIKSAAKNDDGVDKVLNIKIAFEIESNTLEPDIIKYMPRIRDILNSYMYGIREADLSDSSSMYHMREELLLRVNKIVPVADVLFQEISIK